ncbi:hypothetical protein [Colwellia sp. PAMC 21821]|nr:hypothetical protein [Colwellia sp. PAMC 21821]
MKATYRVCRLMSAIAIISALFAPVLFVLMTDTESLFSHYNNTIWSSYQ